MPECISRASITGEDVPRGKRSGFPLRARGNDEQQARHARMDLSKIGSSSCPSAIIGHPELVNICRGESGMDSHLVHAGMTSNKHVMPEWTFRRSGVRHARVLLSGIQNWEHMRGESGMDSRLRHAGMTSGIRPGTANQRSDLWLSTNGKKKILRNPLTDRP